MEIRDSTQTESNQNLRLGHVGRQEGRAWQQLGAQSIDRSILQQARAAAGDHDWIKYDRNAATRKCIQYRTDSDLVSEHANLDRTHVEVLKKAANLLAKELRRR